MIHDGYRPTYRFLLEDEEALKLAEEEVLLEVRELFNGDALTQDAGPEEVCERLFERTARMPEPWMVEAVLEVLEIETSFAERE